MNKLQYIAFCIICAVVLASCTSGRWVVKDRTAVDRSDYIVLEKTTFLTRDDSLTPENPVLQLDVKSRTTYQYQQKMLVQRNIQDYKLSPTFIALGLSGAAAAFYAANSGRFQGGSGQSLALNAVGVLLAASGFINLQPVGNPRPVGEKRYLGNTGTVTETDTLDIQQDVPSPARVQVTYKGATVFEENLKNISGGSLQIPLAQAFNDLHITGQNPGSFDVNVNFQDSLYHYQYPVSSILQPYARITTDLTELRSKPSINPDNVMADLARGSQIRIESIYNDEWFRVLYGISENYIRREDALMLWKSTNLSSGAGVVAVPRVPFGNIDVESNIPKLRGTTPNAHALIITNENYSDSLAERTNTHRDGRLIKEYLQQALGYASRHIHYLTDVQRSEQVYRALEQISAAANDSTELFVYLGGYGSLKNGSELYLNNVALDEDSTATDLRLRTLFNRIASVSSRASWVVSDLDFSPSVPTNISPDKARGRIQSLAATLTINPDAALLVSTKAGVPSRMFKSDVEDKKHHIFPYFFARALQQHRTELREIFSYLERNIAYTSRRLHDRPQTPVLYGDETLSFTPQKENTTTVPPTR